MSSNSDPALTSITNIKKDEPKSSVSHQPQSSAKCTMFNLDQLIEDRILKVTSSALEPKTETLPSFTFTPIPGLNGASSTLTSGIQKQEISKPAEDSLISPQSPQLNGLPQDILHILESNFTATPIDDDDADQKELSRVAEELRVKVRLSRYQRVQGGKQDVGHEEVKSSSEESDSEADEDSSEESEAGDSVESSGDDETEKAHVTKLLKAETSGTDETVSVLYSQLKSDPELEKETAENIEKSPNLNKTPDFDQEDLKPSDLIQASECIPLQKAEVQGQEREKTARVRNRNQRKAQKKIDIEANFSSESESEDFVFNGNGPTTANELEELPEEITKIPFSQVPVEELATIKPFGTITSIIGSVVVIEGTKGSGYDKVLDEGSLVCQENGLVIGKIFETFGSVNDPHYSIRLPSKTGPHEEPSADISSLSASQDTYFVPKYSQFVFTSQLKAQPKGTDASNLYDEEVSNADEVAFSDDEAEAAYLRACKLARKAAAAEKNRSSQQFSKSAKRSSNARNSQNGFSSRITEPKLPKDQLHPDALNYDDEPVNEADGYDYNVLERPKEFSGEPAPTSGPLAKERRGGNNRRGRSTRDGRRGSSRGKSQRKLSPHKNSRPSSMKSKNDSKGTGSNVSMSFAPYAGSQNNPLNLQQPSTTNFDGTSASQSSFLVNNLNTFNPPPSPAASLTSAPFVPAYNPMVPQNTSTHFTNNPNFFQPSNSGPSFLIPSMNPIVPQLNFGFYPFAPSNPNFNFTSPSPNQNNQQQSEYNQSNLTYNPSNFGPPRP